MQLLEPDQGLEQLGVRGAVAVVSVGVSSTLNTKLVSR